MENTISNPVDSMQDYDMGYYGEWGIGSGHGSPNWDGDCKKLKTKAGDDIDRESEMVRCAISKYIYPCTNLPCNLDEIGNTKKDKYRQLMNRKIIKKYCEKSPVACSKTGYDGEVKPIDPICFEINECSEGGRFTDIPDQALQIFDFFKYLMDLGLTGKAKERVKNSRLSDLNKSKADRYELEMKLIKEAVEKFFKDNSINNTTTCNNIRSNIRNTKTSKKNNNRNRNNNSTRTAGNGTYIVNTANNNANANSNANTNNNFNHNVSNAANLVSNISEIPIIKSNYISKKSKKTPCQIARNIVNIETKKAKQLLKKQKGGTNKECKVTSWKDALKMYETIEGSEKGKKISGTGIVAPSKRDKLLTVKNLNEIIRNNTECLKCIKIDLTPMKDEFPGLETEELIGVEIFKRWKKLNKMKDILRGRGSFNALRNMTWGNMKALDLQQRAQPGFFNRKKSK